MTDELKIPIWKSIEVGSIIRIKFCNKYGNTYYNYFKLCYGEFYIEVLDENTCHHFEGKHILCLGSEYEHNLKGDIFGFELLKENVFEIVDNVPNNLFE